jgi:hypothetical protein
MMSGSTRSLSWPQGDRERFPTAGGTPAWQTHHGHVRAGRNLCLSWPTVQAVAFDR